MKGQVKVKGTVNGVLFRSLLMPTGDRTHYLVVNKEVRDAASVKVGDTVQVVMERDTEVRKKEVPVDLAVALQLNEQASRSFENMSYSCQKEYVSWIEKR